MRKVVSISIDPDRLKRAKKLGFENLSFHVDMWIKNWVDMKLEYKKEAKRKIAYI